MQQTFEQRLASIDLGKVMARVKIEQGLTDEGAAFAENLYRKFLTLCATSAGGIVPPQIVDEVWHTHIIHTRQYIADCELLFGGYLHHNPGIGEEVSEDGFKATVAAYREQFGIVLDARAAECTDTLEAAHFSSAARAGDCHEALRASDCKYELADCKGGGDVEKATFSGSAELNVTSMNCRKASPTHAAACSVNLESSDYFRPGQIEKAGCGTKVEISPASCGHTISQGVLPSTALKAGGCN